MDRLEWNGRECVNPPDGWELRIYWAVVGEYFYQAVQRGDTGGMHSGPNVNTEAEAKRACEAALLRLGVLEVDAAWLNAAEVVLAGVSSRDPADRRRVVAAVARAFAALEVEAPHG